jgi:hypothetical protein
MVPGDSSAFHSFIRANGRQRPPWGSPISYRRRRRKRRQDCGPRLEFSNGGRGIFGSLRRDRYSELALWLNDGFAGISGNGVRQSSTLIIHYQFSAAARPGACVRCRHCRVKTATLAGPNPARARDQPLGVGHEEHHVSARLRAGMGTDRGRLATDPDLRCLGNLVNAAVDGLGDGPIGMTAVRRACYLRMCSAISGRT